MEVLAKLFEKRGSGRWIFISIALLCGACLFMPTEVVDRLRLGPILQRFGAFGGLAFVCASTLLVVDAGFGTLAAIRARGARVKRAAYVRSRVRSLCAAEQAVLREFTIQGRNTVMLPVDDPAVAGLLSDGVLVLVGHLGRRALVGTLFPVAISDEFDGGIDASALDLPSGAPTVGDIQRAHSRRPDFAPQVRRAEGTRLGGWP